MDIILIPGLWLHGASWELVVPTLANAGHRVVALTPPGYDKQDPATVRYADLVAAVIEEIDDADDPPLVVGHSASCAAAWAAVDRRPERVHRMVLIGGLPIPDGQVLLEGFEDPGTGILPFPGWQAFDHRDIRDLNDRVRTWLLGYMSDAPSDYAFAIQHLRNTTRYDVPMTLVCPEFTASEVRDWMAQGLAPVAELHHLRDLNLVDLSSGHWPQASQPDELARVILDAAGSRK